MVGLCCTGCPPADPAPSLCPHSKHTAQSAWALQSSLCSTGAASWIWLLGLAVELEEVAVGNATEREKRVVHR